MVNCVMSEQMVDEAFLAGAPLISQTFLNYSLIAPSWFRELYNVEPWPLGAGTMMEQLIFRGSLPQTEEGFEQWNLLDNSSGCDPCVGPNCSYNWSQLGGHALERKLTRLMSRDYRSNPYCVKFVQNTYQFKTVFQQIVQNMWNQINFIKEINIGQNMLTGIAKKYVVDSDGFKPNPENPYVYRPKGTTTLSALNIDMLEAMYEMMRRMPETMPYDVVDGHPVYALVASPQLLGDVYRSDPQLRQDVRFSSLANDLVTRYNFMSTMRGMFFPVPFLWPRRFRYDATGVQWVRVLPYTNGIPTEAGSFTGINPLYEDASYATHEEVLIHGKQPFTVWYQPTTESLGENTSFGPEPGFFDNFQWINPQTREDPFRREGFFATTATIGISAQYSEGVFGIIVPRKPNSSVFVPYPAPICPPDAVDCDNSVPDVGCPCPLILVVRQSLVDPTIYEISLAAPIDAAADEDVQLGLSTGGYITGTIFDINEAGNGLSVTFDDNDPPDCLNNFTTIFCDNSMGCTSTVLAYSLVSANTYSLTLENPIKADTDNDVVTIYFGDGTSEAAAVAGSPNMVTNTWVVDAVAANPDVHGGIVAICVPTATEASCPACGGAPTITQCAS